MLNPMEQGAAMCKSKLCVRVSPEMMSFVGPGTVPTGEWFSRRVVMWFAGIEGGGDAVFGCGTDDLASAALVLVVDEAACHRIFEMLPDDGGPWHLPAELRAIVFAIRDCALPARMTETLRLAKSIELLCAVFDRFRAGTLVAVDGNAALTEMDTARIATARRIVSERWHEKLTLDGIARACGLNRGKLARGFRAMYDCSVTDALTEQRLAGARALLQGTDLPVKAIGYRCGYLNNASFTRAFSRHYGVAPTRFRAGALAA
jgi:AraC family transcriptional activator of pyochelin receptor